MQKLKIPIQKLKPFWDKMSIVERNYRKEIRKIEEEMQKKFKNKDLEFFWVEGNSRNRNSEQSERDGFSSRY